MSLMTDGMIKSALKMGWISIENLQEGSIQPASVDVHLDWPLKVLTYSDDFRNTIDPREPEKVPWHEYTYDHDFRLMPGALILAPTIEKVGFNASHAGQLVGLSSLGRLGLHIHASCGLLDPGFQGLVVMELFSSTRPIMLYRGMRIAQIEYFSCMHAAEKPYGHPDRRSKYQDQTKVEEAKAD